MTSLIAHYGLPLVAMIIFAGELGFPTLIPGEVGLLVAGDQAIRSIPMLIAAVAVFGAIDIIATTTMHLIARTGGNHVLCRMLFRICGRHQSPEVTVGRYRERLGGRDSVVVFCTRLIPVFRLYASIATGLIKVDVKRFVAGAAPAAWLWAAIPLTAGFLLRSQAGGLTSIYSGILHFVIPVSIGLTLTAVILAWLRQRLLRLALQPPA